MIFHNTILNGAWVIEIQPLGDERGFFARTFCRKEFESHGLKTEFVQNNISHNRKKGTLRGMHYQKAPHAEIKLVRCTAGAIFDVIVDIRQKSSTYMQWESVELSASNRKMLYIPEGFAHGFITLTDNTEVYYQMSNFFNEQASRGFHWDDPVFNIQWPLPVACISEKDKNLPNFKTVQKNGKTQ